MSDALGPIPEDHQAGIELMQHAAHLARSRQLSPYDVSVAGLYLLASVVHQADEQDRAARIEMLQQDLANAVEWIQFRPPSVN